MEGWSPEQRPEGQEVGLFAQQCRRPVPAPPQETRRERLSRPRQSDWWAEVFPEVEPPPPDCQWIYVADREADFCEPI